MRKWCAGLCCLVAMVVWGASTVTAADVEDQYLIGSGDILEIVTWKEPAMSLEEVLVRLDGKVSFPLLNDVQAAGLTPLELKKSLESGLKAYVPDPVIRVSIREANSKKFYVLGEVEETGEYPLTKQMRVLQAFAMAGGFTEWASKKEIILLRTENGEEKLYRINYNDIVKGEHLEQNLKIRADDTIIVP